MSVEIKNILVPVDGSAHSNKAAAYAGSLARDMKAAVTLLIVHSQELKSLEGTSSLTASDQHTLSHQEVESIAHERYAKPAFEAAEKAIGEGVADVNKVEVWGVAADEIVNFVEKNNSDLIIIGSRGLGQIKTLLLGSVSYDVMRRAPAPVLVVR